MTRQQTWCTMCGKRIEAPRGVSAAMARMQPFNECFACVALYTGSTEAELRRQARENAVEVR